ncbi:penicillin-binding protein 2 [Armatimonas sp.]|uniref:penicillin-binding protein 2 n=1 Tax=Armatimonas sp. TaxID=1872638 RepID=UPI0037500ED0
MSRRHYFTPLPTPTQPSEEISMGRILLVAVILTVFYSVLAGRLWLLQIVRGDDYRDKALLNRSQRVQTTAPRGIILDRKGQPLVTNATQFAVYLHPDEVFSLAALLKIVDPEKIDKTKPLKPKKPRLPTPKEREAIRKVQEYLDRVADLVEIPRLELNEKIRTKRGGKNDLIPIRENIDRRLMARLYERQDDLPGISVQIIPIRSYPRLKRATHILGYTRPVSAEELKDPRILAYPLEKKYRGGDWIGKQGLEKEYDQYLRGTLGYEAFEVDGRGRRRKELTKEPAKSGANLVLSLDAQVQEVAEKALAGRPGAVVALDPRSGRILALASAPTYDLTLWTRPRTNADVAQMQEGGAELNRATSKYPPGSTFKIITMTAGLASHRLPSGAYCPGYIMMGKKKKKCMGSHGGIDSLSAFAQSCNVFFFQAGFQIGDEILSDWAHRFGLGSKTGIDLPSEKQGTVPSKKWAREKRDRGWWRGDLADMAIGQGFDEATPLQMAVVAATIGNGGTIWKPKLVEKIVDSNDPKKVLFDNKPERVGELGLDKNSLRQVQTAMRAVVERGNGTSRAAAIPGITVAGKSGTAETGFPGKAHGWFTCYAARPGEESSIAVCVLLEATKPGDNFHGGGVCAPIARAVIEAHYNGISPPTPKEDKLPTRRGRRR